MPKKSLILILLILVFTAQFSFADSVTIKSRQEGIELPAILTKPEGNGPFPAVVLLHGCGGFGNSTPRTESWSKRLANWGYVTLAVDSFPVGRFRATSVCTGGLLFTTISDRCGDAYDAKSYLSQLPFVNPNAIAVMGWSHGGWTILTAVSPQTQTQIPEPIEGKDIPFVASIAFYPYCSGPIGSNSPLLILIGEKDDWALPSACSFYMPGEAGYYLEDKPQHEVIMKIFPGAYHDFDWEGVDEIYEGHRLLYDFAAATEAANQVKSFLAKYLK